MFKFPIVIIAIILYSLPAIAQRDSLQVVMHNDEWVIKHNAQRGETVFSIARKYHVPAATLADENGLNYQTGLETGREIFIPMGAYNQVSAQPANGDARALYYIVDEDDNLFRISKYAGVQQRVMQQWNRMSDNAISSGQHLFVGWVLYDGTPMPQNNTNNAAAVVATTSKQGIKVMQQQPRADTVIIIQKPVTTDTLSPAERMFASQTNNGQNITSEKGTAVFFDMGRKINSSRIVYAFHNTAPKGAVIKIHNPGNDKTIYAKVLGPIPGTKQYHESIIGIDDSAKDMLGTTDDRMWCELEYGY